LSYAPARGIARLKEVWWSVKFWFRHFESFEYSGSRRQGGGGGEPR